MLNGVWNYGTAKGRARGGTEVSPEEAPLTGCLDGQNVRRSHPIRIIVAAVVFGFAGVFRSPMLA